MIVDDDSEIVKLLKIILENDGYDVLSASNGINALYLLSLNFSPTIIITDYCMPRLNGSQFIETIHTCDDLNDIPVVILTGSDLISDNLPQTNNFKRVITKPFRINNFLQIINDLLNGYSSVYSA